jgi:hypothetical protein
LRQGDGSRLRQGDGSRGALSKYSENAPEEPSPWRKQFNNWHQKSIFRQRAPKLVSNLEQGQEIFSLAQNILGINLRNFVLKFSILNEGSEAKWCVE